MSKEYYVTLTGGKNNAGDFLIKYRAFNLFKELRKDRDIVDFNEWEPIDDERLEIINNSKALLLLGGPGLVKGMYPNIYKLRENLDDIKVPIIMMGIGWKDSQGDWKNTYTYDLTTQDLKLLDKINNSGYLSSVRDYHTLNSLQSKKYDNFLMTGCPAYYDIDYIGKEFINPNIKKVAFSLGVSFIDSPSMEQQMKFIILRLNDRYGKNNEYKYEVVFHHSIDFEQIAKVYGKSHNKHAQRHKDFIQWLEKQNISYVDISGSAENLINYYSDVDLHIGYRVHAHIFMNSISKFSILINEDGRGKALKNVIEGIVIDGYDKYKHTFISRVLNKLLKSYDKFQANKYMEDELINSIKYEEQIDFNRIRISREIINNNFNIMKKFIQQLP
jgi:hypothetical protein